MDLLKLEEFFEYFKNIDPDTYDYDSVGSNGWLDSKYGEKYCIAGYASIWAGVDVGMLYSTFATIFNIDRDVAWDFAYSSYDQADTHQKAIKFLRNFIDTH